MSDVGAIDFAAARAHAEETVKRSKTSFAAGMRILSQQRRDAMYAIYAFCREVDDIADEGGTQEEKQAGLNAWRKEIDAVFAGQPATRTGEALLEPIRAFDLPKDEFIMMIEGMEMDANGPVIAPTMDGLLAYTRRVAGSVGLLSMPVFGSEKSLVAQKFALSLADALQITNILRDVEEDAEDGRIYLPRELLEKHKVDANPAIIAEAAGLPAIRAELAELAATKFSEARAALAQLDWRVLRPALLMMGVYERYLDKMMARGWANGQDRVTISKFEKIAIALRWFIAPKKKRPE